MTTAATEPGTSTEPKKANWAWWAATVAFVVLVAFGGPMSLLTAAALFLMLVIHELGHYLPARAARMKVTDFWVGFGPALWWTTTRRGVRVGIRAIPLGAFVKIPGMTNLDKVDPAIEPFTYRSKPYRWRAAVILGGSFSQFILAAACLLVAATVIGLPDYQNWRITSTSGPAASAGLRPGDRITDVNGTPTQRWDDFLSAAENATTINVTVINTTGTRNITITRGPDDLFGITAGAPTRRDITLAPRVYWEATKGTLTVIGRMVNPAYASDMMRRFVDKEPEQERPVSIIGVHQISTSILEDNQIGLWFAIYAVINIGIGLINLLPFFPFDGGHFMLATYERIRSNKTRRYTADAKKMYPIAIVGASLIGFYGLTTITLDIIGR